MRFIKKFMYGRYGIDDLYRFLFNIYLLLLIVNLFIRSSIISTLEIIIIFVMFYRCFSKKIYKRSDENVAFLKLKKKFLRPFNSAEKNLKDTDHIYKKCSRCRRVLRLPLPIKRGIKKVKCPKCGKSMRVIVLKKQKIEIIK